MSNWRNHGKLRVIEWKPAFKRLEYGDKILVVVDNVLPIDIIESVINIPSYLNEKKACSIRIILPVIILHGIGT